MRKTTCGWRPISDATMQRARSLAAERDRLSDVASNTRRWRADFNLVGILGEELYGALAGLDVNREATIRDGGEDFPGLDVKTTTYTSEPKLLIPVKGRVKAPLFALVAVDLDGQRARLVGYATREMVLNAGRRDFGYGENYTLSEAELLSSEQVIGWLLGRGQVAA